MVFGNDMPASEEEVINIWDPKEKATQLFADGRSNYSIPAAPSVYSAWKPREPEPSESDDPLYPRPPSPEVIPVVAVSASAVSTSTPVTAATSIPGSLDTSSSVVPSGSGSTVQPTTLPPTTIPSSVMSANVTNPTITHVREGENASSKWYRVPVRVTMAPAV